MPSCAQFNAMTASPSRKSMALKYLASHRVSINSPMIQRGLFINPLLLSNGRSQFSPSDVFTRTQLLTVNRERIHSLAQILCKWLAQSNTDATSWMGRHSMRPRFIKSLIWFIILMCSLYPWTGDVVRKSTLTLVHCLLTVSLMKLNIPSVYQVGSNLRSCIRENSWLSVQSEFTVLVCLCTAPLPLPVSRFTCVL